MPEKLPPGVYGVGDTVKSDDFSLVIGRVTDPYDAPANAFYKPKQGLHLIGVDVVLTNTTKRVQQPSLALLGITIQDEIGHKYTPQPFAGLSFLTDSAPPGGLDPGKAISGTMAFEVPDGSTGLFVHWWPAPLTKARIIW